MRSRGLCRIAHLLKMTLSPSLSLYVNQPGVILSDISIHISGEREIENHGRG